MKFDQILPQSQSRQLDALLLAIPAQRRISAIACHMATWAGAIAMCHEYDVMVAQRLSSEAAMRSLRLELTAELDSQPDVADSFEIETFDDDDYSDDELRDIDDRDFFMDSSVHFEFDAQDWEC